MYESHFGLTAKPFSLLPEANHFYFSKRHQHIVNMLDYGIETQAAFMVITGDVGAGKTSSIRHFLTHLSPTIVVGSITNPNRRIGSLLSWISSAFDLPTFDGDESKMYHGFVTFLLEQYAKGKRTLLVIDEAQNLNPEGLEELRMLTNVNNEQDVLIQIVLSGQPELLEMLRQHELRQFAQRIGAHGHLTALGPKETKEYIQHRLMMVHGNNDIFDDYSCAVVHYYTGGVPRLINLLCDQAMMYAYAEGETKVSDTLVTEAVQDRSQSGLSAFREMTETRLVPDIQQIIKDMETDS